MKITDNQLQKLNTLVVERFRDNKVTNLQLVQTFANNKNLVLEKMIKSDRASQNDESGTIAYYVVKDQNGVLLLYFSLKCGELFEDLDVQKLMLAQQTADAIEVIQNPQQFTPEKVVEAEAYINANSKEILKILPNLNQYVQKKRLFSVELKKELNTKMRRVLHTIPAVEIVEICSNDNGKTAWESLGIVDRKMGECIFWHIIVPKLLAIQNIVGCQYVYLFAADKSYDGNLVNYYQTALHFRHPIDLGANKPQYDFQCLFLCQTLKELMDGQRDFYENFSIDRNDGDVV